MLNVNVYILGKIKLAKQHQAKLLDFNTDEVFGLSH